MRKRKLSWTLDKRKQPKLSFSILDLEDHIIETIVLGLGRFQAKAFVLSCRRLLDVYKAKTSDRSNVEWFLWTYRVSELVPSNCNPKHVLANVDRFLRTHVFCENIAGENVELVCKIGHIEILERLLQCEDVDPAADNNCAIRWASEKGHFSVVERLLLFDGVDPTAKDNYAIKLASQNGHLAVVKRLLQCKGVNPTAKDNYAIQSASRNGHLSVVERLLQCEGVDLY